MNPLHRNARPLFSGMLFLAFLLLPPLGAAWAAPGLKENLNKNRNLPLLLQAELQQIYASEKAAEKGLEELKAMIKAGGLQGDRFFAFHLLGRIAAGEAVPEANKAAKWLGDVQEDALDPLLDAWEEDDYPLGERELAMDALARVAQSTTTADLDLNEAALKQLVEAAHGKETLLSRAALPGLGRVLARPGKEGEDLVEAAGKGLAKEVEHDDPERSWFAVMAVIEALKAAPQMNDGVEAAWEALNDQLDEFDSPLQQAQLKSAVGALLRVKTDKAFAKLAAASKKELEAFDAKEKVLDGDMNKVIARLDDADDQDDLEEALQQGLRLSTRSTQDENRLFFWLQSASQNPKLSEAKLRFYYLALQRLANDSPSPLAYFQAGRFYLGQLAQGGDHPKGLIALGALTSLLSSSDEPGMVLPLLEEVLVNLRSDQPYWTQRRLVALVFMAAADSPSDEVNEGALQLLIKIQDKTLQTSIAWEVQNRLQHLATAARNKRVAQLAALTLNPGKS